MMAAQSAPGPARVSARLQQKEAAAAKSAENKEHSSGNGDDTTVSVQHEGRSIKPRDIEMVQQLIERCLQLYMPLKDVVSTLQAQAKIEPGFTNLVWQKLEEQNQEFFEAYYLRLQVKEHVVMFNHLVEQQMAMTQKLHTSWMQAMPALMARPPSYPLNAQPMQPDAMQPFQTMDSAQPNSTPSADAPSGVLAGKHEQNPLGDTAGMLEGGGDEPLAEQRDSGHPTTAAGAFTLPLSPLDPASLAGLDDILLMGGGAQPQPTNSQRQVEEEDGLRILGDGTALGAGQDDLIDLGPGWGRQGQGHDDGMMMDPALPAALGRMDKNFSMSDLKGWGDHCMEEPAAQQKPGAAAGGDPPGTSERHDTSNAAAQQDTCADVEGVGVQESEAGDAGMDGGVGGLGVSDCGESAGFHSSDAPQGGPMPRPFSMSDLPPLGNW